MIAYKYKLYTTKQTKHLDAMLREASWVWNHALALQKRYYRMYGKGHYIDVNRMKGKWPQWYGKSSRLHSQTVQEILERLDAAYDRFFHHKAKRPPKFKAARFFTSFLSTEERIWEVAMDDIELSVRIEGSSMTEEMARAMQETAAENDISLIRASSSYKLGNALLSPLKYLRRKKPDQK